MPEKRLNFLLIAAEEADTQAIRRALPAAGLGAEVQEAATCASARALLQIVQFDCVLCDSRLPDGDGLELLREMRSGQNSLPFILLTEASDEDAAADLIQSGASDFLPKDRLTAESLGRSLRTVLRLYRTEQVAQQADSERRALWESLAAERGQSEAIIRSMAEGLVVSDLNGTVLMINPAALRLLGFGDTAEAYRNLRDFSETFALRDLEGQAVPPEAWPLARAARGETFSGYEVSVARRNTGNAAIFSFNGTPVRSRSGEVTFAILTIRDVTELRQSQQQFAFLARASAVLASSLDYRTTLSNVAHLAVPQIGDWCAVDLLDEQGTLRRVEAAHKDPAKQALAQDLARRFPSDPKAMTGPSQVFRTGQSELVAEITDDMLAAAIQNAEHLEIMRALGLKSYMCVPLTARGRTLGAITLISSETARRYGPADLTLAEELAQRAALAVDNALLYLETSHRAEREALVNKVGRALRVTMDSTEILRIVTREVGLALSVSRCGWAWINPARDAFEAAPPQFLAPGALPPNAVSPFSAIPPPLLETWAAERPVVINDFATEFSLPEGASPVGAFISCPVFLRGQWIGIFSVHQTDKPRHWTAGEVEMLSAITDILALALENARLYAREHRVADMLQSAFLSNIPDSLPGLTLASSYRAGLEESQVGGDFYDAFTLPDGRVALVMADVSGKGLNAAVQTATVKFSLRAFAAEAAAPSLVLTRLNRTLRNEASGLGEHFVTLFYAVFDPATGRLTYASAGHEAQIMKRAAGGTTLLSATGPILGVAEHSYNQQSERMKAGDSVVLYTDGLTEARSVETRELLDLSRVVEIVEGMPREAGPGAVAALLQQKALAWAGGRPHDDMALLVARCADHLPGVETPSPAAVVGLFLASETPAYKKSESGALQETLFDFTFPSHAEFAAEVRQALEHWMATLGFDRETIEDFQTAATEAVTNAVRYGSPQGAGGEFRVFGSRSEAGAITLQVTDQGSGLPEPKAAHPMPGPDAPGGRGLPLMRELADSVEFLLTDDGHCVRLTKDRRG